MNFYFLLHGHFSVFYTRDNGIKKRINSFTTTLVAISIEEEFFLFVVRDLHTLQG